MKSISAEFIKSATKPAHYPDENLPEVAFVGRSNVGKSSLINTLVQQKNLAKTSNTPGRTQLINFFKINDRVFFVDLPGYGFAKVPLSIKKKWGPMVETYLKERQNLKLVIFIFDIRRTPAADDVSLLEWFNLYNISVLFVLTKMDKLSRTQANKRKNEIKGYLGLPLEINPILFSARTGEGKETIWQEILKSSGPNENIRFYSERQK
jgi:GTP-binding protein